MGKRSLSHIRRLFGRVLFTLYFLKNECSDFLENKVRDLKDPPGLKTRERDESKQTRENKCEFSVYVKVYIVSNGCTFQQF